ncbi:MAG: ribosome maturation factor RimP [Clostridium sp.]
MKIDALIETIDNLIRPIADDLNYEIYHIEYVKENGEYYLRIYIDQEDGIKLSDCEAMSRRVSEVMDTKDPITEAYFLEVSSPGLNRGLYNLNHYKRFIGKEVIIRFTKALDGKKNINGILKEATNEAVTVEGEETIVVPMDKIKSANLDGEI